MTSFTSRQLQPPSNWQDFEKLCHLLWMKIWKDDNAVMHGRQGQSQYGVDVYGRIEGKGDYEGIQCKGKDANFGGAVTDAELRAEVTKAKKFEPKLSTFILATTAQNDAKIQVEARKITEEHEKLGLFSVIVLGWGEIHQRLALYPDVIEVFYPDQGPSAYRLQQDMRSFREELAKTSADNEQRLDELPEVITKSVVSSIQDERSADGVDAAINDEIDRYKELLSEHQPRTALALLEKVKSKRWGSLSDWLRFRVVTNIGAAHLTLGEQNEAARCFQEANQYAPHDKIAACNTSVAYSLLGMHKEARLAAIEAAKKHPYFTQAHALVIATSCRDCMDKIPESLVPNSMLQTAEVSYAIGQVYLIRRDFPTAKHWMEQAYSLDAKPFEIRTGLAEVILSDYFENEALAYGSQLSSEQRQEIIRALELLEEWWNEVKCTEIVSNFDYCAINICNAYRLLNDSSKGQLVLDEALAAISSPSTALKRQKALMAMLNGKYQVVVDTVDNELETEIPDTQLMKVEALKGLKRYPEAYDKLKLMSQSKMDSNIALHAKLFLPHLIKEIDGINAALEEAKSLAEEYSDLIAFQMLAFELALEKQDEEESNKWLDKANALVNVESKYVDRLMVADGLFDLRRFSEAAAAYSPLILSDADSKPLRRHLASLVEDDQRKAALGRIASLPKELQNQQYYCRLATKLFEMVGDLPSAKRSLESYFVHQPNDLHMRLLWINVIERLGEDKALIKTFLDTYTPDDAQDPINLVALSQVLAQYGRIESALQLAYKTRRNHFDLPESHTGYLALTFFGKTLPEAILSIEEVAINTAFTLEEKSGEKKTFLIEGELVPNTAQNEIGINHPMAKSAIGKRVGDSLIVSSTSFSEDVRHIVKIEHKFIYAMKTSMEKFNELFPADNRFSRVQINPDEIDAKALPKSIIAAVSQREDLFREIKELYVTQHFPIAILAKLSRTHPIDMWGSLVSDGGIQIICCSGQQYERDEATKIIKENRCGYIVDPVTLYTIFMLGIQDAIHSMAGQLGITQSSIDLIRTLIEERKNNSDGFQTLLTQGEEIVRQEITTEAVEQSIQILENICTWAKKHCDIVTAIGSDDMSAEGRKLSDTLPQSFKDAILAARGHNRTLLSDDIGFRIIASSVGVESIWVQPLLMEALSSNKIKPELYNETIVKLIRTNYRFITVNGKVLFGLARQCEWVPSDDFKVVAATLGEGNCDPKSSIEVATSFLGLYWSENVPIEQKQIFTFAILNGLTSSTWKFFDISIMNLIQAARLMSTRLQYLEAIRLWCAGHFIPLK
ncbi:MAG: hypothetical protein K9M17_04555 [Mariprofundaceae bacterium]|nr:hypothetical protein [Mariprofundaceae bacterium]